MDSPKNIERTIVFEAQATGLAIMRQFGTERTVANRTQSSWAPRPTLTQDFAATSIGSNPSGPDAGATLGAEFAALVLLAEKLPTDADNSLVAFSAELFVSTWCATFNDWLNLMSVSPEEENELVVDAAKMIAEFGFGAAPFLASAGAKLAADPKHRLPLVQAVADLDHVLVAVSLLPLEYHPGHEGEWTTSDLNAICAYIDTLAYCVDEGAPIDPRSSQRQLGLTRAKDFDVELLGRGVLAPVFDQLDNDLLAMADQLERDDSSPILDGDVAEVSRIRHRLDRVVRLLELKLKFGTAFSGVPSNSVLNPLESSQSIEDLLAEGRPDLAASWCMDIAISLVGAVTEAAPLVERDARDWSLAIILGHAPRISTALAEAKVADYQLFGEGMLNLGSWRDATLGLCSQRSAEVQQSEAQSNSPAAESLITILGTKPGRFGAG